jgi:hypothetical protein
MPDLVIWLCFALATLCLAYALIALRQDSRRRERAAGIFLQAPAARMEDAPPPPPPHGGEAELALLLGRSGDRVAALVVAFLLALLGVAAAAVDHKVRGDADDEIPQAAAGVDVPMSARDHSAFARIEYVHSGSVDHDLCVARFYSGKDPAGPWWTTCGLARSVDTVGEARNRLALRNGWGNYDKSAEYTIPAGTDLLYADGIVAAQCRGRTQNPGCARYDGGGRQYFFPYPLDPGGAIRHERCAAWIAEKSKRPPLRAEYRSC